MNIDWLKKSLTYIGYLLVVFCFYFLGSIVIDNISALGEMPLTYTNISILILSLFLYIIGYLIFSFAWLLQLRIKYPSFSFKHSVFIIGRSQIAKYLPGNIGHFLGRLVLLPQNIKKTDVTYTMFVENIVMLFTSSIVGFFYIFYFDYFKEVGLDRVFLILATVSVVGSIFYLGLKYLRSKYDFLAIQKIILVKVLTLSFVSIFIGGVTIYLLVFIFGDTSKVTYLQCVTGFALSFIVGFIVPGAPGGIGIREFTFVMLFGNFVTEVIALQIILSFRLISVVGDVLLFSLTQFIKVKQN